MERDPRSYLWDMQEAANAIAEFTASMAVHRAVGKGLVHALRVTALAEHALEGLRSDDPAVKLRPALSQRILKTLFQAWSESI
jgi:hypothetical protein